MPSISLQLNVIERDILQDIANGAIDWGALHESWEETFERLLVHIEELYRDADYYLDFFVQTLDPEGELEMFANLYLYVDWSALKKYTEQNIEQLLTSIRIASEQELKKLGR